MSSIVCSYVFCLIAIGSIGICQISRADEPASNTTKSTSENSQKADQELSVEEVRALLCAIAPYLPAEDVVGEIDIFGSTSMDVLAHGWARGFKKFHPNAKVVISAEGSESVFERLAKRPTSMGMLSRPVSDADIGNLKKAGLKRPVAILVARDAMGVFVHESNPLTTITYEELVALFCTDGSGKQATWGEFGVEGELADKPVDVIGRKSDSGTRKFIEEFLFRERTLAAKTPKIWIPMPRWFSPLARIRKPSASPT